MIAVLLSALPWAAATWGGLMLLVAALLARPFMRDRKRAREAARRRGCVIGDPAGFGWLTPEERRQFDRIAAAETEREQAAGGEPR